MAGFGRHVPRGHPIIARRGPPSVVEGQEFRAGRPPRSQTPMVVSGCAPTPCSRITPTWPNTLPLLSGRGWGEGGRSSQTHHRAGAFLARTTIMSPPGNLSVERRTISSCRIYSVIGRSGFRKQARVMAGGRSPSPHPLPPGEGTTSIVSPGITSLSRPHRLGIVRRNSHTPTPCSRITPTWPNPLPLLSGRGLG